MVSGVDGSFDDGDEGDVGDVGEAGDVGDVGGGEDGDGGDGGDTECDNVGGKTAIVTDGNNCIIIAARDGRTIE